MAKALTEAFETSADRMLQMASTFFNRLLPTLTVDDQGQPQIRFELRESKGEPLLLDEILSSPALIAAKRKCRVVVVFDEFQRILEYENDRIERTLRSAIQNQPNVSYIFLGSRKHLIQRMVLDSASPLYRAGGHYPLGPIPTHEWIPFIQERFEASNKRINETEIRAICAQSKGHPFYTQHLCHAVWELCSPSETVTNELIESAVDLLLERELRLLRAMGILNTKPTSCPHRTDKRAGRSASLRSGFRSDLPTPGGLDGAKCHPRPVRQGSYRPRQRIVLDSRSLLPALGTQERTPLVRDVSTDIGGVMRGQSLSLAQGRRSITGSFDQRG